ncbi:E3 ubiquitin-protein ligase RNF168 [Biomphalaria glabrata]|nr:E3 ubiquitin-protein ligase RNF168 [Biomphalaria glabrata]
MIVHLEKDMEALSSLLEENWKLIKKIEPFRDVLDNFQMDKKFLLERDKYTSEQMERLTQEAIKNMGHQNHRQKVKYVETLKKTPGEPRIPFKGKKMLSESECMCPVCISLLLQPVTFHCNHSLCLKCYKETVEKANLSCPVCRKRISVWARKAAKENKLINMEKWTDIQEAFPEKVRRRLEASEESDKEDNFEAQERRQISCPGEIRQEYEAAIQQIQQKKDEQAKKEEEAKEKALMLEKKKSKKNSLLLNPVVRLKKCVEAEDIVLSWRANNCLPSTETFHESSQLTENRSAIPAGNSSVKNDDLKFSIKLQEFFDLMDKKRIVVDRSKGSSNEYTLLRKHKCDE